MSVQLSAADGRHRPGAPVHTHFKRDRRSERLDYDTQWRINAAEDAEDAALRELRQKIKHQVEEQ